MDQDADGSIRAQTVARLVRGVLDAIGTAGTTGALQVHDHATPRPELTMGACLHR